MQKRLKLLIIGFLFFAVLATLPNQVSAAYLWEEADDDDDECLVIEVLRAEYLDYDKDGNEDDVITVFEVITPEDEWEENGNLYISCAVAKPSGASIGTTLEIRTRNGVEITIVWFNWADEPGDYTFYVKAEGICDEDVFTGYIEHVFDPPGGKIPDMPEIVIMSIDELR